MWCCSKVVWCCGAVVMWCCGAVVIWYCGAVVMWCCSAVVMWCCSAVVMWCCGAVVIWCCSAVVMWCCGAVHTTGDWILRGFMPSRDRMTQINIFNWRHPIWSLQIKYDAEPFMISTYSYPSCVPALVHSWRTYGATLVRHTGWTLHGLALNLTKLKPS